MRNYVTEGNIVTFTAGAAITASTPVLEGSGADQLFVVPAISVASGEEYTGAVEGVFELPKESTADFSQGDPVYWDSGAGECDESASGRYLIGFAFKAAAATTTVCEVKLAAQPVTPVP